MSQPAYSSDPSKAKYHETIVLYPNKGPDTIRYAPVLTKLDHTKHTEWSDYPDLCPETQKEMASYCSVLVFQRMHYHKDFFSVFFNAAEKLGYKSFKYYHLDEGDSSFKPYDIKKDQLQCRILHRLVELKIKGDQNQQFTNIANGEYGRIDNLKVLHISHVNRIVKGKRIMDGVKTYIQCKMMDEHDILRFVYMVNTDAGLEIIESSPSRHDHVLAYILEKTPVNTPKKMCAYCGKLNGDSKKGKLLKCPCKSRRYCGKECQRLHWQDHKLECQIRSRLKEDAREDEMEEMEDKEAEGIEEQDTQGAKVAVRRHEDASEDLVQEIDDPPADVQDASDRFQAALGLDEC